MLVAVVALSFWPVLGNGFISYDDGIYVTKNPQVRDGLTAPGIVWALTTDRAANWHPLTWISHMVDVTLFGLHPFGHHLTSLLLHAANALFLFLVLDRATGARGRSFMVAALFGVHPLHVESVAWVAERKDVLSTLFWMLAMLAYVGTAREPATKRMALVAAALAAGLAAKPMLVTLPFVLLLLDVWPLERGRESSIRRLVAEKLPLLPLVAASSVITLVYQSRGGAVSSLEDIPFSVRGLNAVVAYAAYLRKAIWPSDLAIFYPHPVAAPPVSHVVAAAAVLTAISAFAWLERRRRPYLLVGWLWYLGTLVPVIGLVQVGAQGMADRYTYVPLIGVFIMTVWGVADLARAAVSRRGAFSRSTTARGAPIAVAAIVLAACVLATRAQTSLWRDSMSLYRHALDVTGENPMVLILSGMTFADERRYEDAIAWYDRAIAIRPRAAWARTKRGEALVRVGRIAEAQAELTEAIRLAPRYPDAWNALGMALARAGRPAEAAVKFEEALRIESDHVPALTNLATTRMMLGNADESLGLYRRALARDPDYAEARTKLGLALAERGDLAAAIPELRLAVALDPTFAEAHQNLALALALAGDRGGARAELDAAARLGMAPSPIILRLLEGAAGAQSP